MTENDIPFFIPPREPTLAVEFWQKGMVGYCRSQDMVKKFTVKSVIWFKEKGFVGHEYLVFTVQTANSRSLNFLWIERNTEIEVLDEIMNSEDPTGELYGDDAASINGDRKLIDVAIREELNKKIEDMWKKDHRTLSRSRLIPLRPEDSSVDSPESSPNNLITAHDTARSVAKGSWGKDHRLFEYCFNTPGIPPLTLRDLAIVARVVHDSHDKYCWKTHNCYWYARTIMEILVDLAEPSVLEFQEHKNWAGRPGSVARTLTSPFLEPIQPDPAEITNLIGIVRKAIQNDNARIQKEYDDGPGELKKQKERAEEACRKAEEARRRLEESQRKEEEARRQHEVLIQRLAQFEANSGPSSTAMSLPVAAA